MRKNNSLIVFAFIGIAIIVLFMITATYAYFSVEIRGNGKDMVMSSFNQDMEITYHDTSNFSLVNAYTGESISKTFDVENTGDTVIYYDIVFTELVNNFENISDLVYTLTSVDGGINKQQTVVPNTDNSLIGSYIKINPTSKHTYTLTITFLNTEDNQISNMNTKTFSTKVSIKASSNINNNLNTYNSNSLGYAVLNNNTPQSDALVNFNGLPTDGLYYTNNSIDGATVYYFRGSTALNNNVLFAGYCWKIIRTTEDLGIRLLYNGPHSSGACSNTTETTTYISTSAYYTNISYNAYVGFKYGAPNSSTYASEHANTNKSTIKTALDSWYSSNILSSYNSYIADSYYCNNREPASYLKSTVYFSRKGYSNYNTGYNSYYRLSILSSSLPSLNCTYKNDIFTVSNTRGNASGGSYPVGLITADEAIFGGYNVTSANNTSYLYNASSYWTMTPAYFESNALVYYLNSGSMGTSYPTSTLKVRPVITLKQNTVLLSGNGSTSTPYKITN